MLLLPTPHDQWFSVIMLLVMVQGEWMAENPLGVPTEREKLTLSRGDPVFRTIFRYEAASIPSSEVGSIHPTLTHLHYTRCRQGDAVGHICVGKA